MSEWALYDAWEHLSNGRTTMEQATRDAVREGAKRSAAIVLPMIFDTLGTPSGLLDVGAGEGHWMVAYRDLYPGSCLGVDVEARPPGSPGTDEHGWPWIEAWDAQQLEPLPLRAGSGETPDQTEYSRWPLALCLETAEHLTPTAGDHLVAELCRVADEIVWSAGIPGQGGDGHINEQWPAYWAERFWAQGFEFDDPWRCDLWHAPGVEPWYAQNLLYAYRPTHPWPHPPSPPLALVHPVTWAHHRGVAAP